MPKSPLQRAEWKILGMAISDARLRAARGELKAGYACLVAGLRRMEEFVTGGEPWAGRLLDAYRTETRRYEESYPAAGSETAADPHRPEEVGGGRSGDARSDREV